MVGYEFLILRVIIVVLAVVFYLQLASKAKSSIFVSVLLGLVLSVVIAVTSGQYYVVFHNGGFVMHILNLLSYLAVMLVVVAVLTESNSKDFMGLDRFKMLGHTPAFILTSVCGICMGVMTALTYGFGLLLSIIAIVHWIMV